MLPSRYTTRIASARPAAVAALRTQSSESSESVEAKMPDLDDKSQLCGFCAKLSVVCKCRECDKELCKSCCTVLHSTAGLGHVVVDTTSQSRLCQLHDWEKLTVYSIKSKSFGCIRCFQEGPLKGNQGLSLQVREVQFQTNRVA